MKRQPKKIKRVPAPYADPYERARLANAKHFGCDPDDLGECMRCGSPWPSGMKRCPECAWDGVSMEGVL